MADAAGNGSDPVFLLMCGQEYLQQGYEEVAAVFIRNAYSIDNTIPSVKECLRDINERLISRWHFLMLNDVSRNSLFNNAIAEAIKRLDKSPAILDIGVGTGILRYFYIVIIIVY